MPGALRPDTLVCVDFDDTLVRNQEHFDDAVGRLCSALGECAGASPQQARDAFERVDARYHHLGRHRNRFLLTVLAAYCEVAGTPSVPLELVPQLAGIAALPYDAQPVPAPGARAALKRLRAGHPGPLWLVTTGDPVVQAGRVQRSGLASIFDAVHVLPEKTAAAFAVLGRGHPSRVMIGNSPLTDVLPALEAGFDAMHVRAATWRLDLAPVPESVPVFADFTAAVAALLGDGAPPLPPEPEPGRTAPVLPLVLGARSVPRRSDAGRDRPAAR